jgi:hypothetical protein
MSEAVCEFCGAFCGHLITCPMVYNNQRDLSVEYIRLRADLQRVTAERDQLKEDLDQDFLAKKELDSMLFARTQELKERTRERDALKEAARETVAEYDIFGVNTQELHDAFKKLRYALAAVKPETCVWELMKDNPGWHIYKTACGEYIRSIAKPIRLCKCGRPIEQKEV